MHGFEVPNDDTVRALFDLEVRVMALPNIAQSPCARPAELSESLR